MKKNMFRCRGFSGQFTLYALFMTVISIIAYTVVYPVLVEIINESGISGVEGTILSLTPLLLLLFIIWGGLWYVYPYREQ